MLDQKLRWTAFFGTDDWIPIVTRFGPALRVRSLQRLYERQLQEIGYDFTQFVGSMKNTRRRTLYRPLFASKNKLGAKFFGIAATPERQQPRFDFE